MVDNSTQTLGPLTVWTLAASSAVPGSPPSADNAVFPWGLSWSAQPDLIVTGNRLSRRTGAMGSGSLTLLRDQRQEPNQRQVRNYSGSVIAGSWVAITANSAPPSATAPPLWWGWVSALSYSQVAGTIDGMGSVAVLEVGHLLDQQQITNFQRATGDGGYGEVINSPAAANSANAAGVVIGNAKGPVTIGTGGQTGYAFARLPQDCGTGASNLWTRWRLLRHVLYACWPTSLPTVTLLCADGSQADDPSGTSTIAGYLNDTSVPEVFDLRNLTIKGALDLCIPQARGFGWTIEFAGTGWQVVIYSYATTGGAGGLPVNNAPAYCDSGSNGTDLSADRLIRNVQVVNESATLPDEVWIEGSPIVFGATVSFADLNLQEGWSRGSGKQEDLYRLAASGAGDYSSLSTTAKLERNAMVRASPGLRDVYTRYALRANGNGDVRIKIGLGAVDGYGTDAPICPSLTWDGTSAVPVPNLTISRVPYLPECALARTLPWPEGLGADGTDTRPPQTVNVPQLLRPKVFAYDPSATTPWIDLESRSGRPGLPSMHLDVDDRGAAVRVTLSQPEYLAYRHWSDAAGGTTSPAASDVNPDTSPLSIDYTKLVATIGIESDQRVLVKVRRPGLTQDSQIRKRLILRDPNLQCWAMPVGTILGLKNDGTPDRITGTVPSPYMTNSGYVFIRNDFPTAQRRANMVAAWTFRPRVAVTIDRSDPTAPPAWARVGYLMTKIIEAQATPKKDPAVTLAVNTVVDSVDFDFSGSPHITVATSLPSMPGFAPVAGSGGSPSSGGGVSMGLGGTVAQAVATLQASVSNAVRDTQRVPVIVPRPSPGTAPVYQVAIIGGNVLSSGAQGIKSASVTSVPAHYNPMTDTSMVDGVGYGYLGVNGVFDGVTKVLVVNNGAGQTYNAFPLIANDVILSSGTVSIPVGAGPDSVSCYTVG